MLFFKRYRTVSESGLFKGFADCHSHVLPGVDDGLKDMGSSLAVLDRLEKEGEKDLYLTPHVMEDLPNATAMLQERFTLLKDNYKGNISLHLGAEYMLDLGFRQRLESRDLLPLANHRLLVETSCVQAPYNFWELLQSIRSAGYMPVLAHPERYAYMGKADYARLKKEGTEFQLNLPSFAGFYGPDCHAVASQLLKAGMYDYVGTDTHSISFLEHLLLAKFPLGLYEKLAVLAVNNRERLVG